MRFRRNSMLKTYFAACMLLLASAALAQQPNVPPGGPPANAAPPAAGRGPAPLAIPNPHYVSIPMTLDVNAPVEKVWARIGKFCDIGEWQGRGGANTCTILSGTDGDFGAVRSVANEVLVGKTKYSYTYAQAPRVGVPYNLYHGTLEAVPLTATTTRLNYTLFFDNSMLADDAARAADLESRRANFTRFLGNMKILAEGGTLPSPAPRPSGAAAAGPGGAPAGGPSGAPNAPRPAQAPLMSPTPHYVSIPMTVTVN